MDHGSLDFALRVAGKESSSEADGLPQVGDRLAALAWRALHPSTRGTFGGPRADARWVGRWHAPDGSGTLLAVRTPRGGTPLVMLPTPGIGARGFLRIGEDGRSLAGRLAASGFDVYLPTMRVTAASAGWEPWHDVRAVLAEVARQDGRPPWLLGHGFAGWWAVAEAARGAVPCAGVALLGTPSVAPAAPLSTRVGLRALATWGRPVPTPHLTRLWAVSDGRSDGAAWRALLTEDAEPVASAWVAELGRWLEHGRPCLEQGRWDLGLAARAVRVPLVSVDPARDPSAAQVGRWTTWWGGPAEAVSHTGPSDLASLLVEPAVGDALAGALLRAAGSNRVSP